MTKETHYPASHGKPQFHCPHCNVYSKQRWSHLVSSDDMYSTRNAYGWTHQSSIHGLTTYNKTLPENWTTSICEHCGEFAIWKDDQMIYPKTITVELPNTDLSEEIKTDYMEAANVLNDSPRASAALLRLALQKLCIQLGEKGENINDDIGQLVSKGLNPTVQKSLDALRITGNNAVHPGEIDLSEDTERVLNLFKLINFIAEKMLTEPKEISSFYEALPEGAKEAIEKRDTK